MADFLHCLSASPLESLGLYAPVTASSMRAAARISALRELYIDAERGRCCVPGEAICYVTTLTQLEVLSIRCGELPAAAVGVALQLPALRMLQLGTGRPLPAAVTGLTALSQLTQLSLYEAGGQAMPRHDWPDLLALPALEDFTLQGASLRWGGLPLVSAADGTGAVMVAARLEHTSKAAAAVAAGAGDNAAGKPAGRQVTTLDLSNLLVTSMVLELAAQRLAQQGLSLGALQLLQLTGCHISAPDWVAELAAAGGAATLTELSLSGCWAGEAEDAGLLISGISRLVSLKSLTLARMELTEGQLLANIAPLTGLESLYLDDNALADLPPGPYLSALNALCLRRNRLQALPASLASATRLNVLYLTGNQKLRLTVHAVRSVLVNLPELTWLDLRKCYGHRHGDETVRSLVELARKRPDLHIC